MLTGTTAAARFCTEPAAPPPAQHLAAGSSPSLDASRKLENLGSARLFSSFSPLFFSLLSSILSTACFWPACGGHRIWRAVSWRLSGAGCSAGRGIRYPAPSAQGTGVRQTTAAPGSPCGPFRRSPFQGPGPKNGVCHFPCRNHEIFPSNTL
ncbi:hypothetical protein VTG60DRAFT_2049 [Thermothelomyces hinnuleus]